MLQILAAIVRETRHVHTLTRAQYRTAGGKPTVKYINAIWLYLPQVILHRSICRRRRKHKARDEVSTSPDIGTRIPCHRDQGRKNGPADVKVIQPEAAKRVDALETLRQSRDFSLILRS